MLYEDARQEIANLGRCLEEEGLLFRTTGNLSARISTNLVAITPSSISYADITPADVAVVNIDGEIIEGCRRPSSELPMHLALYRIRPDVGGIVHTHAPYATTLAVIRAPIPAVHYEIAALGVDEIPVIPYATYGTAELAEQVKDAMDNANAALLANHGTIAIGPTLEAAATFTRILEFLAELYYRARLIGDPVILPREEILRVRARFRGATQSSALDSV